MNLRLLFISIIILSVTFVSCKEDNPSAPKEEIPPPPGKRDYEWKYWNLNDMFSQYNNYEYLGGPSPDNVWISGGGEFTLSLIHCTGNNLTLYDISDVRKFPSVPTANYSPPGSNITWFGGGTGEIYKEEGGKFTIYQKIHHPEQFESFIEVFHAENSNDMIGAGAITNMTDTVYNGCVWVYENGKWEAKDTLKNYFGYFDQIKRGRSSNGEKIYLREIVKNRKGDSVAIYEYDHHSFRRIYYEQPYLEKIPEILSMNDKVYFFIDKKLQQFDGKKFFTVKDFSSENIIPHKAFGRSINDFFIASLEGLYHYNGTDVKFLYKYPHAGTLWKALFFEKDVYFLIAVGTTGKTALLHGRLKG